MLPYLIITLIIFIIMIVVMGLEKAVWGMGAMATYLIVSHHLFGVSEQLENQKKLKQKQPDAVVLNAPLPIDTRGSDAKIHEQMMFRNNPIRHYGGINKKWHPMNDYLREEIDINENNTWHRRYN